MTLFINEHPGLFALIIIGVVVLVLASVLVGFLVIRPAGFRKQLRNIERKYQYCNNLLNGQDAQNVKKLEIISRTNLLYVDIHTKYLRRFNDIKNNNDSECENALTRLKDLISDKEYRNFKEEYKTVATLISDYESTLKEFTDDISKVVQPEVDCRQSALAQKEELRHIKQEFFSKESELSIMADSFDQIFKYIDELFAKFEERVDSAQYDDANAILPEISGFLSELNEKMVVLPDLCTLLTNVVPEKIHSIELLYKEMVENHYPLQNLSVNQYLGIAQNSLDEYLNRVKQFDTEGIQEELSKILVKLDNFVGSFEKEKEARNIFADKCEPAYEKVNSIEKSFIKLRNELPELSEVFVINSAHQAKIKDLQKDVNKVGGLKRTLDTYIHSTTKQPYSLLVTKIEEIERLSCVISEEIEEFTAYLESLKRDSEAAYDAVYSTFDKIKKAEELIRLMNLDSIYDRYRNSFDELYSIISQINETLLAQPIDVEKVNELLVSLYELSNSLLDEGEVAQDYNMMVLAENSIVYGNKHRNNLTEIDQLLSQAEVFFNDGKFEEAYKISANALKKIKQSNGK